MILDLFEKTYIQDFWDVYGESFPQNQNVQTFRDDISKLPPATLQKQFSDRSKLHVDAIFDRDESVIDELTFEGFKKHIYSDLQTDEKEKNYFWETMTNLLKCSSVIDACGNDLSDIEDISKDFVQQYNSDPNNSTPQDMTQQISKIMANQMMSNTGIFPKLMGSFSDPERAPGLMQALAVIMRQPQK
jgi:hypothetical protein